MSAQSFCQRARAEAAEVTQGPCCRTAMLSAAVICSGDFSGQGLVVRTSSAPLRRLLAEGLEGVCGVVPSTRAADTERGRLYRIAVDDTSDAARVCAALSIPAGAPFLTIDRTLIRKDCCRRAWLRGAFIGCGTLCDPHRGYRLEFRVMRRHLALDLGYLLAELGYPPKAAERAGSYVSYYKDSESIEDILNLIGARGAAFELMNVKIEKDFRNNANRRSNCDVANADKLARAAAAQLETIEQLQASGRLALLPPELAEVAALRLANPELASAELGALCAPPLSKSSVSRRFARLAEYAALQD